MDKNKIKSKLNERFLTEEATPGIKVTKANQKKSGEFNKDGVKAIEKDTTAYNKSLKQDKDTSKMAPNKFNYTDDFEKEYHDQMEIMNGQEMIQYDRIPNDEFKERALEAIEGSSRMGNNPEWANVVAKGQGGDPEFGKNLAKNIKASMKKRGEETPAISLRGKDIQDLPTKKQGDNGHKPIAIEEAAMPKKPISDKNRMVLTNWLQKYGAKESAVKLINALSGTGMVSDLPDSIEYGQGLNKIEALLAKNEFDKAYHSAKSLATKLEKKAMKDMGMYENKNNNNNPKINESMKRLKFKSPFNGLGNALKLIPEGYKVDKKEFEMTDDVETYKVRWEGNLNEGKAVVLTAADNKLINEDIQRMKALFGYKPQDTLGLVKGKARVDENAAFTDVWAKTRKLMTESEEIEGQDAEKEAPFEEADVKHAPEAKKHIQGSVSQKDLGGVAPKPKEGHWEEIKVKQASEAKEHVEGSVSEEKKTEAPAPKEGEWEEVKKKAPEATKHVESGKPTHMATDKAKVVKESEEDEMGGEEGEEEEEDSYYKPEDDDSTDEKEPSAKDIKGDVPMDTPDDEEDAVKVPAPKASAATIMFSPSTGTYWIKGPGLPPNGAKVPDEFLGIASDKSMKASERASLIIKKLEAQDEMGGEEEELDEYSDEHPISTKDAVDQIGVKK